MSSFDTATLPPPLADYFTAEDHSQVRMRAEVGHRHRTISLDIEKRGRILLDQHAHAALVEETGQRQHVFADLGIGDFADEGNVVESILHGRIKPQKPPSKKICPQGELKPGGRLPNQR